MRLLVHVPTTLDAPDDWDPEHRARLQQLVTRAVERAARGVQFQGVQVEVIRRSREGAPTRPARPTPPAETVRERLDETRLRPDEARYGIPSFDDGGAETATPIVGLSFEEGIEIKAGGPVGDELLLGEDRIVRRAFPRATIIQAAGNRYYFASGNPYVVAANLARALGWGAYLFGSLGFAVFQPDGGAVGGPFYAVGLESPLHVDDLDGLDEQGMTRRTARLISPAKYSTVAVVTADHVRLSETTAGNTGWDSDAIDRTLAAVAKGEFEVDPADAELAANFLTRAVGSDAATIQLIVKMDRTLFAAMPWDTRAQYLTLLTRGWIDDERKRAILEVIQGTRNQSELEAVFAILRERGIYATIFRKLDGSVFELLQYLGEFQPAAPVRWQYLVELLVDAEVLPTSAARDPVAALEDVVDGLVTWLIGMVEGIASVVTEPDKILKGLGSLASFLLVIEKARLGDSESQALVFQMLWQGAAAALKAIRGLQYAEELGTTYGRRGGGIEVASSLLRKLQAILLFEILSWFIGLGEIKAAVGSLEIGEKLAVIARLLRSIRLLGGAADAAAEAGRLERVLVALARLAEIAEEARLARVVELIPEEHLALVNRLAKAVDLPAGADAARLAELVKGDAELTRAMETVGDSLAVAGRLEARAAEAGGLTPSMAAGLRVLLARSGLDRAALVDLIDHLPAGRIDEYMHALQFVRPEHFAELGAKGLRELADHPRALGLLREGGSELLSAVRRRGAGWDEVERIVDGLAVRRDQIGNPAEYRRLLDRLTQGEAAAFDEVGEAVRLRRLAEATQAGPARLAELGEQLLAERGRTNLIRELEDVEAELGAARRAEYAAELARMPDKEVGGLEHLAALERSPNVAERPGDWDWTDVVRMRDRGARSTILTAVDDIGGRTSSGLARAVGRCLDDPQGGIGQLLAAQTLVRRYGATELKLELMTERMMAGRRVVREFDVEATIGGRSVHVEVKTNMPSLTSDRAARASEDWGQIGKDLAIHARADYQDLLYLYHPAVQGQLPRLGQSMLEMFGGPGLAPDALLVQRLNAEGVTVSAARQAFERWLANGGLTTY